MDYQIVQKLKRIDPVIVELDGPYECPSCGGHMVLDATFLDQVSEVVICPYCETPVMAEEIQ